MRRKKGNLAECCDSLAESAACDAIAELLDHTWCTLCAARDMQAEIDQLRLENDLLRREVASAVAANEKALHTWEMGSHGLESSQITRYSRQILLRSFGAQGT